MTPQSIIEITFTKKAFGLGIIVSLYWKNICLYLPFVSILYNYNQKKTKDNKYIDVSFN